VEDDLAFLQAQAQTAVRTAQRSLLSQGIGHVFSNDGLIVRRNPDGTEDILSSRAPADPEGWRGLIGVFRDDPIHAEVVRLGRAHRESLTELRPRIEPPPGSNGMEYVFGNWPGGDETDEQILAALEAIE
jgi:hypothetical protein